jgi:hypothetical protein
MGEILLKRFDEPDEVTTVPNMVSQVVVLGDTTWLAVFPSLAGAGPRM